jgi:hypothetical protein
VASCLNCGSPVVPSEEKCPTCGSHVGFPNVRAVNAAPERAALQHRYKAALERAEFRGATAAVAGFRAAVETSSAVVNCSLYILRELAEDVNALYSNYYLAVRGEVRRAAEVENDTQRRAVGAILFGAYAENIRSAALSLDGIGLASYGAKGPERLSYGLMLRDVAIAKRASLLEENEYDFVKRHSLTPSSALPVGYRCAWENRNELATAKLADIIGPETQPADYARILLSSTGDRASDQFIEVHIYGPFNLNSISSVSGNSAPKRSDDRAVLTKVKELLEKQGKQWIETL